MPLDTSIPLQVQVPQLANPMDIANAMARQQAAQQEMQMNALRMQYMQEDRARAEANRRAAAAQAAAAERRRQELMNIYGQFGATPAAVGQRGTSYSGTGMPADPYAPITSTLIQRGFVPQAEEFAKLQKEQLLGEESKAKLPGIQAESRKKGTEADVARYDAAVSRLIPLVRSVKNGQDAANFTGLMYDDPDLGPKLNRIVPREQAIARAPGEYEADPLGWTQSHMLTGKELSDALAKVETLDTTGGVFEYAPGKGKGRFITTPEGERVMPTDKRAITTIDMRGEGKFAEELAKVEAGDVMKGRTAAQEAANVLDTINTGRNLLDKGVISGFGADFKLGFAKVLKEAGVTGLDGKIENTETYASNMAKNVGALIKQFGSGTGLSNADREYAEKMAGGKIALDEGSMRQILDISERAARNSIALHNKRVEGIPSRTGLTVEMPSATPSAGGGASVTTPDGRTFSFPTPEAAAQFKKAAGIP